MSDNSQIRNGLSHPETCEQGCARWDKLAEDGNTEDQNVVRQKWLNGKIPDNAGNTCAQPENDKKDGPWCYCAGKNNASWGYCQNRNNASSICKSIPNGLKLLYSQLDNCRDTTEESQIANFAKNSFKIEDEIYNHYLNTQDTLLLCDNIIGNTVTKQIGDEIRNRKKTLEVQKERLQKEIEKSSAIIERTDRDFIDTKETLPESLPKKSLHVIEDYTIGFLYMAYTFAFLAVLYYNISNSEHVGAALIKGVLSGGFVTIILFTLLYFLA